MSKKTSVAASAVKDRMVFEVTKQEGEYTVWNTNTTMEHTIMTKSGVTLSVGDKLTIIEKPRKIDGINLIDFSIPGSNEVYRTHWISFKTNTKLISKV